MNFARLIVLAAAWLCTEAAAWIAAAVGGVTVVAGLAGGSGAIIGAGIVLGVIGFVTLFIAAKFIAAMLLKKKAEVIRDLVFRLLSQYVDAKTLAELQQQFVDVFSEQATSVILQKIPQQHRESLQKLLAMAKERKTMAFALRVLRERSWLVRLATGPDIGFATEEVVRTGRREARNVRQEGLRSVESPRPRSHLAHNLT